MIHSVQSTGQQNTVGKVFVFKDPYGKAPMGKIFRVQNTTANVHSVCAKCVLRWQLDLCANYQGSAVAPPPRLNY